MKTLHDVYNAVSIYLNCQRGCHPLRCYLEKHKQRRGKGTVVGWKEKYVHERGRFLFAILFHQMLLIDSEYFCKYVNSANFVFSFFPTIFLPFGVEGHSPRKVGCISLATLANFTLEVIGGLNVSVLIRPTIENKLARCPDETPVTLHRQLSRLQQSVGVRRDKQLYRNRFASAKGKTLRSWTEKYFRSSVSNKSWPRVGRSGLLNNSRRERLEPEERKRYKIPS